MRNKLKTKKMSHGSGPPGLVVRFVFILFFDISLIGVGLRIRIGFGRGAKGENGIGDSMNGHKQCDQ